MLLAEIDVGRRRFTRRNADRLAGDNHQTGGVHGQTGGSRGDRFGGRPDFDPSGDHLNIGAPSQVNRDVELRAPVDHLGRRRHDSKANRRWRHLPQQSPLGQRQRVGTQRRKTRRTFDDDFCSVVQHKLNQSRFQNVFVHQQPSVHQPGAHRLASAVQPGAKTWQVNPKAAAPVDRRERRQRAVG